MMLLIFSWFGLGNEYRYAYSIVMLLLLSKLGFANDFS
jgi:hypothetical protein